MSDGTIYTVETRLDDSQARALAKAAKRAGHTVEVTPSGDRRRVRLKVAPHEIETIDR